MSKSPDNEKVGLGSIEPLQAEFLALENTIKCGKCPDSPTLLLRYFRLGEKFAKQCPKHIKRGIHTRILDTLLEVICDTYLAQHWRNTCLEYCYRPLFALQCLATTEQDRSYVAMQKKQFSTLSHYFCHF